MKKAMFIEDAARVYRAMTGDKLAMSQVTFEQADGLYNNGDTFAEFIRDNDLQVYEEVVR